MNGDGDGSGGLSKLGVALTVIFAITLLALLSQFFYFLWRRRVFRSGGRGSADQLSLYSASDSTFSSKELLYFFCIRPDSRIESNSIAGSHSVVDNLGSNRQMDVEGIDVDVFKLQGMFGPPRFLFTIKEEEKEDLESPADKSLHAADKFAKKIGDISRNSTGSLKESFQAADDAESVALEIGDLDATPLSTPCDSPLYFTPSASPVHEAAR